MLVRVDDYNAARVKMSAEMADSSNLAKTLVIKAEDMRILGDMTLMRRAYSDLYTLNSELVGEYTKRSTNHQASRGGRPSRGTLAIRSLRAPLESGQDCCCEQNVYQYWMELLQTQLTGISRSCE